MNRELKVPAIYKHFKNKLYTTMGIPVTISIEEFRELSTKPNTIYFRANDSEKEEEIPVINGTGLP